MDQGIAENQDEIDKIMSEIEELQQEMSAATPVAATPTPAPPAPETPAAEPTVAADAPAETAPVAEATEPPAEVTEPPAEATEPPVETSQEISQSEVEEILAEASEGGPAADSPTVQELEENILKEFSGEGEEPWLEETLANLKPESETPKAESGNPEDFEAELEEQRKVVQLMPSAKAPRSSDSDGAILGMSVQGKMTIQLNYEDVVQVTVGFNQENVHIQLSDGTEFKIPTKRNTSKKLA